MANVQYFWFWNFDFAYRKSNDLPSAPWTIDVDIEDERRAATTTKMSIPNGNDKRKFDNVFGIRLAVYFSVVFDVCALRRCGFKWLRSPCHMLTVCVCMCVHCVYAKVSQLIIFCGGPRQMYGSCSPDIHHRSPLLLRISCAFLSSPQTEWRKRTDVQYPAFIDYDEFT